MTVTQKAKIPYEINESSTDQDENGDLIDMSLTNSI